MHMHITFNRFPKVYIATLYNMAIKKSVKISDTGLDTVFT